MASQYKNAAVWTTSIEQIQYQKRRHFLDTGLPTRCGSICVPWAALDI